MTEHQPQLFAPPRQPAPSQKSETRVYPIILRLREFGFVVQRCGRDHLVDGKMFSSAQLRRLLKAVSGEFDP